MSIDGICVQVRGNVQLGVSLARNSIWQTSTKEKRISAFRGCETPSRPTKKAASPLQILLGEHCRSHSLAELRWKVTGVPVPVLAQTPLLGHPRAFQRYFAYQVPHSGRPCNHV